MNLPTPITDQNPPLDSSGAAVAVTDEGGLGRPKFVRMGAEQLRDPIRYVGIERL